MSSFLFDFHVHFSFKPANSANFQSGAEPDPDHYAERLGMDHFSLASLGEKTVIKSSQINGDACANGRHRILCNGLYPLERGFIKSSVINSISTLTGFSLKTLRDLESFKLSYFDALEREYNNLLAHQNDPTFSKQGSKYVLANSFDDIMAQIAADKKTICIVNSVEGAHSFASDLRTPNGTVVSIMEAEKRHIKSLANGGGGDADFEQYVILLRQNLDRIKTQWAHVPFFAGLSHHYYNHLAGHSPSLTGIVDLILNQDGATIDANSQPLNFYYVGIHNWGRGIVNTLLSRQSQGMPVRRILIDVKHMSPQARLDYYALLDATPDRIPIIKSHTAVSGRKEIKRSINNEYELFEDEKEACKYFYDGIVNLFDDEIQRIVNSDGLIGMMIDERRIMGKLLPPESGFKKKSDFNKVARTSGKALNEIVRCKHKIKKLLKALESDPGNAELQKKIQEQQAKLKAATTIKTANILKLQKTYLSVIFRQIFHILDLTGKKGWDHLCLGTDYDGVINPIDIYPQCNDMLTIFDDLNNFWNSMLQHSDPDIRNLYQRHLHGKTPDFWIRKLLILNGMNFLKKYFNDAYLRDGVNPATGWVLTSAEEMALNMV